MTKQDEQKLREALENIISEKLIGITLSKKLDKTSSCDKVTVKPLKIKGKLIFQYTTFENNQVFHNNLKNKECLEKICELITAGIMGQLEARCVDMNLLVLTNKKGTVTIKKKSVQNKPANDDRFNHDRTKQYILNEGEKIDFLMALGVMTPEFKIAKARFDKFKQLNRYLEFVRDILPELKKNEDVIRIVDFGCGKSYLTFALYYYLKQQLGLNVNIIGLDLKESVIKDCNALAAKLKYTDLRFYCGDIQNYEEITGHKDSDIDMVITLHACDTATDYAINKAVKWNAKVIMAVPCCQKEMNRQLKIANTDIAFQNVIKYSLIKERMAALMTDAYRANCLEEQGYDVQVMEFIDMEHTPKNILIRAVKKPGLIRTQKSGASAIEKGFGVEPTLGKIIRN